MRVENTYVAASFLLRSIPHLLDIVSYHLTSEVLFRFARMFSSATPYAISFLEIFGKCLFMPSLRIVFSIRL